VRQHPRLVRPCLICWSAFASLSASLCADAKSIWWPFVQGWQRAMMWALGSLESAGQPCPLDLAWRAVLCTTKEMTIIVTAFAVGLCTEERSFSVFVCTARAVACSFLLYGVVWPVCWLSSSFFMCSHVHVVDSSPCMRCGGLFCQCPENLRSWRALKAFDDTVACVFGFH
jgi:hypothetical protein